MMTLEGLEISATSLEIEFLLLRHRSHCTIVKSLPSFRVQFYAFSSRFSIVSYWPP